MRSDDNRPFDLIRLGSFDLPPRRPSKMPDAL
jgi:hypothetical protein